MESKEVKIKIVRAFERVYENDKILISTRSHEQTICARAGIYLQVEFEEFNVDVEYNRQYYGKPKVDSNGRKRKIDIIIHRRGPDGPNVAAILVKGYWNLESRDTDKEALYSIKQKHHYKAAYFIELQKSNFYIEEVL